MSQSLNDICESRSAIIAAVRIATGCTTAAILLDFWAIAFQRTLLIGLLPITLASLALLVASGLRWLRRDVPAMTLSPEGLMIKWFAAQTIPWQAVKSATLFSPIRSQSPDLAIVFDNDRVRSSSRRIAGAVPRELLEYTLKTANYGVDPKTLGQFLNDRIAAAKTQPWSGHVTNVQVRGRLWASAIGAALLAVLPLSLFASLIDGLHDDPLRRRIAAPNYPQLDAAQRATAQRDIISYPRDTRVRLAYAERLAGSGRLADAEAELTGALADKDALRAVRVLDRHGRKVGPNLDDRIKMLLAVVLARQHKLAAAKASMDGLCSYSKDSDMPMLIKLDLCHSE